MRVKSLLTESYECVKIGGILRNLSNDEMKIYKKVKSEGRVFKMDLSEYDANVATTMVSKGLLRRKKAQQDEGHGRIYYTTIGRKGHLSSKELTEVAPPGKESEKWIRKNKKRFKEKYGKDYEKYLYGKAWNNYNGKKKVNESINKIQTPTEEDENYINDFLDMYNLVKNRLKKHENAPVCKLYYSATKLKDYVPDPVIDGNCSKIQEILDEAYRRLAENVAENCDTSDYAVYTDGEYDAEATHENILNNYDILEIMKEEFSANDAEKYIKEFLKEIENIYNNYISESKEPEFSGDFDAVQVVNPNNSTDDEYIFTCNALNSLITKLKDILNTSSYGSVIMEKMINLINDITEIYNSGKFDSNVYEEIDEAITRFKDNGYEYVDNYLYDTDRIYIIRGESEYDSDATWDNIYNEDYQTLYNDYGDDRDDGEYLIDELESVYDDLNSLYGEEKNIDSSELDDAGSEFNE